MKKKYNIKKHNILGHSDIAPSRKKDPGEKFPGSKLAKKNLCIWHKLDENKIKKKRFLKIKNYEKKEFFKNLIEIGYFLNKNDKKNSDLIKTFQRRFRPSLVNGEIDLECFLIAKNLIKTSVN